MNTRPRVHPDVISGQLAAHGVTIGVLNGWRSAPKTVDAWIELAREYTDEVPEGIPGTVWRSSFRVTLGGQRMIETVGPSPV